MILAQNYIKASSNRDVDDTKGLKVINVVLCPGVEETYETHSKRLPNCHASAGNNEKRGFLDQRKKVTS